MTAEVFSRADYDRDGYFMLPAALGRAGWAQAADALRQIDDSGHAPASYEPEFDEQDGTRRLRKLRRLMWNDPELWGPILTGCGATGIATQVLGPGATLVFHAAFMKPALIGTPIAAHQDQALWSRPYPGAFSMWIALSRVAPDNGGLWGCPCSHQGGPLEHAPRPDYPWHDSLDLADPRIPEPLDWHLEPGDAVLWDRYFVHGSGPNTSAEDRVGVVAVFADANQPDFTATDTFPVQQITAMQ